MEQDVPIRCKPETAALLLLTEHPYEDYNTILLEIKEKLEKSGSRNYLRVLVFDKVLQEELPLTTLRRACQTAIRVAMGEENVPREFKQKKKKGKSHAHNSESGHN